MKLETFCGMEHHQLVISSQISHKFKQSFFQEVVFAKRLHQLESRVNEVYIMCNYALLYTTLWWWWWFIQNAANINCPISCLYYHVQRQVQKKNHNRSIVSGWNLPRAGITMFDDRKCSNPSSLCWAYLMSALIMMMISEGVYKKHGCAVGYIANVNYINVCLLQIINHCYISRLQMKMNKDRSYRNLII